MSNKLKRILAISLLATIGLAGCDNEVQAKPADYKNPLVTLTPSEEEIYHNLMSIIEDAYRDGSLASDTLDKILYTYSVSVFGRYNKIAKPYDLGEGEVTLKLAASEVNEDGTPAASTTNVDAFINSHKAYWTTDNDGNRLTDDASKKAEYARVREKWNTIEERIAKTFYDAIKSSYKNDRGYFSEEKYLKDLKSQMKHVKDYVENPDMTIESQKIVITPDVQEEDVFEEFDTVNHYRYLHRQNYQDEKAYTLGQAEEIVKDEKGKITNIRYIEEEIIPTIYRNLLIEQYLLDESYNNLGRSAAREVNVIALSANSNNDKAASSLAKYFVRNVISSTDATVPEQGVFNQIDIEDFKEVSNAYKGLVDTTGINAYLDKVNAAYLDAFPYDAVNQYYVGTDYGDMMANYIKITNDINTTDSSMESDFTGSYTHTKEVGKEIKTNDIKTKDYVTDGWFVKSGAVGDLPDDIKSRLFNIGIANVLDNTGEGAAVDRIVKVDDTTYKYEVPANESKLVAKINGKYYLKVSTKQSGALDQDDILFNQGGKYYVVQIKEAVSGSKLAKESTTPKYDASKKEAIINDVARVVANNDTYKSASTKHWLEQAAIKYHDTKIYDYFKENYPDLFK